MICWTGLETLHLVQATVSAAPVLGFGGIVGWVMCAVWVGSGCCRGCWCWCWAMWCFRPWPWMASVGPRAEMPEADQDETATIVWHWEIW